MAFLNKDKSPKSPFSIAGHCVGLGITAIAILVYIAILYKLHEGSLNE